MKKSDLPSVVLFGSAARGDNDARSDVDILIIEAEGYPQSIKVGKIEVHRLSRTSVVEKANSGDLFMLHVLHEGVVISDPGFFMPRLRETFKFKKDYSSERREALVLASFIVENWRHFKNKSLLNKRIAWSVRTAIISRLVEDGRIIFSPKGLGEAVRDMDVSSLIDLRRSTKNPEKMIPSLRKFVCLYGGEDFLSLQRADYARLLKGLGKSVALSTFQKMLSDADDFSY